MSNVNQILEERLKTHGDFTDVANTSTAFKNTLRASKNWNQLTDIQKESLEMVLHKVSRILNGDPNNVDHWQDIIGYIQLVIDRLNK